MYSNAFKVYLATILVCVCAKVDADFSKKGRQLVCANGGTRGIPPERCKIWIISNLSCFFLSLLPLFATALIFISVEIYSELCQTFSRLKHNSYQLIFTMQETLEDSKIYNV